nr:hypothetical protein [Tanacetum cinerariifolium]
MTSFDYRLNPRYAIKECSSCGALYTEDFCCSKWNVEDKILVPKLNKYYARCARCGHPVDGPYCQGCALLREKLEEDLVTYFQNFQNTSESSDDSTNVVNAPREPFVVEQDHGVNSAQNPPYIDECCYECGDALDGIFCQQCTCSPPPQLSIYSCEFCESNAQYGHYCTPQVPFINPKPGYSQDINFPQDFQDFLQQYICGDQCGGPHETFQCQQVIFYEPCCENCGGPHENFQCQPLNYCEPNLSCDSYYSSFDQFGDFHPQQYLCCENCGGPHENFQCQPLNYCEPNLSCDSYYSSFDQFGDFHPQQYLCCENCGGPHETYHCQTPQYTINHPIFNDRNNLLSSQTMLNEQMTQLTSMCEMLCQIVQKKQEEKRIEEEQAAKAQNWKLLVCYDDYDDEEMSNSLQDNINSRLPSCYVVTPSEPVDSLSMGDEHLDTIPATKSDEFIKSCVENLVPNPSESEGENGCDMPSYFTTFSNILFDANYDFESVDDQSLHNEDVSKKIFSNPLFEEEIISIRIDQHHFNVESDLVESMLNRDSSVISHSSKIDSLLDEFVGKLTLLKSILPGIDKADCHPKNKIRFSERLLYDISSPRPPEEFVFENSNVEIESFSPSPIPIEDRDNLFLERLLHDDPIPLPDTLDFSNVVRVFLPFFTYPVTSSLLLSSGSEDTIFDIGISNYHFSSFKPDLSHRCGTFKKFNTHRSHLNESPMEILFSTCEGIVISQSHKRRDRRIDAENC